MCDTVTVLTSCAASLIDGKTHYHPLKIPMSSKILHATTTSVKIINVEIIISYGKMCLFIIDEDSIAERSFWCWFKHTVKEARGGILLLRNRNQKLELVLISHYSFFLKQYIKGFRMVYHSFILLVIVNNYHQLEWNPYQI